jgi:hypothetical protein
LAKNHGFQDVEPICRLIGMLCLRCSKEVQRTAMMENGSDLILMLFSFLFTSHTLLSVESRSAVTDLLRQLPETFPCLFKVKRHVQILRGLRQIIEECDMKSDRRHVLEIMHLLASFSSQMENKRIIAESPGLIHSIVSRMTQSVRKRCELNVETALLFKNLAMDAKNRPIMASHTQLIELLILLLGDKRIETQSMSIGALKLLIMEAHTRKVVLSNSKKKIFKALQKALDSKELRLDATQMITNLIISRKAAVDLSNQSQLLKKFVAYSSQSEDADLARAASQTLKRIATHVPTSHESYGILLDSIIQQSESNDSRVRYWACRAFLAQSLIPGSSFYLVRHSQMIGTLSRLANDENSKVKAAAIEVLHSLASNEANVKRLALDSRILDALVSSAEAAHDAAEDETVAQARRHAIQAILHISSHSKSKRRVAKHFGLVKCLSAFAISNDDDNELKIAAIHGVLMLVPLM